MVGNRRARSTRSREDEDADITLDAGMLSLISSCSREAVSGGEPARREDELPGGALLARIEDETKWVREQPGMDVARPSRLAEVERVAQPAPALQVVAATPLETVEPAAPVTAPAPLEVVEAAIPVVTPAPLTIVEEPVQVVPPAPMEFVEAVAPAVPPVPSAPPQSPAPAVMQPVRPIALEAEPRSARRPSVTRPSVSVPTISLPTMPRPSFGGGAALRSAAMTVASIVVAVVLEVVALTTSVVQYIARAIHDVRNGLVERQALRRGRMVRRSEVATRIDLCVGGGGQRPPAALRTPPRPSQRSLRYRGSIIPR